MISIGLDRGVEILRLSALLVHVDSPLVKIWKYKKLLCIYLALVLKNISEPMPSYRVERGISTNSFILLKLEAVKVIVEDLVLE